MNPARQCRWPRLARLLLLAVATTAGPAQADTACMQGVLERLGWQVAATTAAEPSIVPGEPCRRASAAAARAAGDLRLAIPQGFDDDRRQALLQALLEHPATLCGYAFELGEATRRATERLQANRGYRFSALQLGWIGFGPGGARAQGWQRFRSFGRGYRPDGGNARAIEAFYSGRVRSECGVGRQLAQLATQRELYGDDAFDREFDAGELSIGTFLTLHRTDSILLGRRAGELFADGKAELSARRGRQAFVGVPGFIEHVFDRGHLDDIHNQAENFVVTDVGEAAAAALARHGGFAHYDRINRRIWELSRRMPGSGSRRFERLLYERDAALRAALPEAQRPLLEEMDGLLADPFYRGFMVYVHPRGVRPVGYHIARLLDRNPRTPYSLNLALHNLHTTLYRRWLQAQLRDCMAGGGARIRVGDIRLSTERGEAWR
ncbi:hypothetical protein OK348_12320 [Flavobacterium sp. MXW15]|uniref:Uncharacterized protein n=1 Tax=Xanthomonas chitinilytica TaxID=2989819 RepID=A0ABT3JT23_9XANT|nr:hypothetical protein [Xanthomonas sp. H13-6]MCW4455570.1 hypothetical protein [Flavobacterium sp. MXW15]MCW4471624.1 hypothetical protein [Xanthomonas sp. H13-6]